MEAPSSLEVPQPYLSRLMPTCAAAQPNPAVIASSSHSATSKTFTVQQASFAASRSVSFPIPQSSAFNEAGIGNTCERGSPCVPQTTTQCFLDHTSDISERHQYITASGSTNTPRASVPNLPFEQQLTWMPQNTEYVRLPSGRRCQSVGGRLDAGDPGALMASNPALHRLLNARMGSTPFSAPPCRNLVDAVTTSGSGVDMGGAWDPAAYSSPSYLSWQQATHTAASSAVQLSALQRPCINLNSTSGIAHTNPGTLGSGPTSPKNLNTNTNQAAFMIPNQNGGSSPDAPTAMCASEGGHPTHAASSGAGLPTATSYSIKQESFQPHDQPNSYQDNFLQHDTKTPLYEHDERGPPPQRPPTQLQPYQSAQQVSSPLPQLTQLSASKETAKAGAQGGAAGNVIADAGSPAGIAPRPVALPDPVDVTVNPYGSRHQAKKRGRDVGASQQHRRGGSRNHVDADSDGGHTPSSRAANGVADGDGVAVYGVFYPDRYVKGADCIRLENGTFVSRSRFEKLGSSPMAKWYRSIRVVATDEQLGSWLKRHQLEILTGKPRQRRQRNPQPGSRGGSDGEDQAAVGSPGQPNTGDGQAASQAGGISLGCGETIGEGFQQEGGDEGEADQPVREAPSSAGRSTSDAQLQVLRQQQPQQLQHQQELPQQELAQQQAWQGQWQDQWWQEQPAQSLDQVQQPQPNQQLPSPSRRRQAALSNVARLGRLPSKQRRIDDDVAAAAAAAIAQLNTAEQPAGSSPAWGWPGGVDGTRPCELVGTMSEPALAAAAAIAAATRPTSALCLEMETNGTGCSDEGLAVTPRLAAPADGAMAVGHRTFGIPGGSAFEALAHSDLIGSLSAPVVSADEAAGPMTAAAGGVAFGATAAAASGAYGALDRVGMSGPTRAPMGAMVHGAMGMYGWANMSGSPSEPVTPRQAAAMTQQQQQQLPQQQQQQQQQQLFCHQQQQQQHMQQLCQQQQQPQRQQQGQQRASSQTTQQPTTSLQQTFSGQSPQQHQQHQQQQQTDTLTPRSSGHAALMHPSHPHQPSHASPNTWQGLHTPQHMLSTSRSCQMQGCATPATDLAGSDSALLHATGSGGGDLVPPALTMPGGVHARTPRQTDMSVDPSCGAAPVAGADWQVQGNNPSTCSPDRPGRSATCGNGPSAAAANAAAGGMAPSSWRRLSVDGLMGRPLTMPDLSAMAAAAAAGHPGGGGGLTGGMVSVASEASSSNAAGALNAAAGMVPYPPPYVNYYSESVLPGDGFGWSGGDWLPPPQVMSYTPQRLKPVNSAPCLAETRSAPCCSQPLPPTNADEAAAVTWQASSAEYPSAGRDHSSPSGGPPLGDGRGLGLQPHWGPQAPVSNRRWSPVKAATAAAAAAAARRLPPPPSGGVAVPPALAPSPLLHPPAPASTLQPRTPGLLTPSMPQAYPAVGPRPMHWVLPHPYYVNPTRPGVPARQAVVAAAGARALYRGPCPYPPRHIPAAAAVGAPPPPHLARRPRPLAPLSYRYCPYPYVQPYARRPVSSLRGQSAMSEHVDFEAQAAAAAGLQGLADPSLHPKLTQQQQPLLAPQMSCTALTNPLSEHVTAPLPAGHDAADGGMPTVSVLYDAAAAVCTAGSRPVVPVVQQQQHPAGPWDGPMTAKSIPTAVGASSAPPAAVGVEGAVPALQDAAMPGAAAAAAVSGPGSALWLSAMETGVGNGGGGGENDRTCSRPPDVTPPDDYHMPWLKGAPAGLHAGRASCPPNTSLPQPSGAAPPPAAPVPESLDDAAQWYWGRTGCSPPPAPDGAAWGYGQVVQHASGSAAAMAAGVARPLAGPGLGDSVPTGGEQTPGAADAWQAGTTKDSGIDAAWFSLSWDLDDELNGVVKGQHA